MAYLEETLKTGVKFYASLTRQQAKDIATKAIYDEEGNKISDINQGAICFVSDSQGNSIFLNGLLFGDGAKASSGGSSNPLPGLTEVTLSDIVITEKDGKQLTLADYFNNNGDFITDSIKFYNQDVEGNKILALEISKSGITIGLDTVVTQTLMLQAINNINTSILETALSYADNAESNAKNYADNLLSSVYKIKGTVNSYADLENIESVQNGDVYNVKTARGTTNSANYTPPGTNYVYIKVDNESDPNYPGYWDALGGTIDFSGLVDSTTLSLAVLTGVSEAKSYADSLKIDINNDISTQLNSVNAAIQANAANIQANTQKINNNITNINTNTTNINNIATQLTWQ